MSQTEVIEGRDEDMARNNAGGFSFKISPWDQLDRFLVLGTDSNTYYSSAKSLSKENAQNVIRLVRDNPARVIERVVEISESGRAPKNDPALFVLALAASDAKASTRKMALDALPKVARIGTHLFHFAEFVNEFRGWGKSLRRAVSGWYSDRSIDSLAMQVVKYQSRDGWSHRDMLRLSHPKADTVEREAVFRWVTGGVKAVKASDYVRGKDADRVVIKRKDVQASLPATIQAFEQAKTADEAGVIKLITDFNLPREAILTEHLNSARVWEALLERMPMTAMVRNLATMTRVGLLTNGSAAESKVLEKLGDASEIARSRIHPIQMLSAGITYGNGRGARGSNTWTPLPSVVQGLNDAFYESFHNVAPSNRKTLLALDVSGSMTMGEIGGVPGLNPRIASAALALVTARVESDYDVVAFTPGGWSSGKSTSRYGWGSSVQQIKIKPKMDLQQVIKTVSGMPFCGTDCALPILWSHANKLGFENFAVYTDNETYAGSVHPSEALIKYRSDTGIPARLAVVGMTATGFTIADPKDAGMMDFVGFDSAAPQIMNDFFSK